MLVEPPKTVEFDKGLIAKWEHFFTKRYGCGPMLSRALGTFIVSSALYNAKVTDKMGAVVPSLWFFLITKTGTGKSPPLATVRKVLRDYDGKLLGPARFTVEGLTAHITGKKTKADVDEPDDDVLPHTHLAIVRDEMSSLLEDRTKRTYLSGMDEFLSELWDGYLQGYRTRGHYSEGNVPVYITLFGAASHRFLRILDEAFFEQGIGNRPLWIDEKIEAPLADRDFFLPDESDAELEALTAETHEAFKILSTLTYAVFGNATGLRNWSNEIRRKLNEGGYSSDMEAGYMAKQVLNVIKLSIVYSASRFAIIDNNILVMDEDMKLAISDIGEYAKMWRSLVSKWQDRAFPPTELRLPTRKIDLSNVLAIAKKRVLFTHGNIKADLDTSDGKGVAEVLGLGINKGHWVEVPMEDLSPEEVTRFKPRRGPFPQVFKITEDGMKI